VNHPTTRDLRNLFFLYNKQIDGLSFYQNIHLRNKEFEDHRPLPHINWNGSYDKIMVDDNTLSNRYSHHTINSYTLYLFASMIYGVYIANYKNRPVIMTDEQIK